MVDIGIYLIELSSKIRVRLFPLVSGICFNSETLFFFNVARRTLHLLRTTSLIKASRYSQVSAACLMQSASSPCCYCSSQSRALISISMRILRRISSSFTRGGNRRFTPLSKRSLVMRRSSKASKAITSAMYSRAILVLLLSTRTLRTMMLGR